MREEREEEQGCAEKAGVSGPSTGHWGVWTQLRGLGCLDTAQGLGPAGSTSEGWTLHWGQEHHQPESQRDDTFSGEAVTEGRRVGGEAQPLLQGDLLVHRVLGPEGTCEVRILWPH